MPKDGHNKGQNGRDLVDTEEIKKRWKEYMEELYKKDLNEPDYYDGVVSHPEPDIVECEVGHRKHCCGHSWGMPWNSSRASQNPKR